MGLRAWSNRLDQRAQTGWRKPYVGAAYIGLAVVTALYGLLGPGDTALGLGLAGVWLVLGLVSLLARARDRR